MNIDEEHKKIVEESEKFSAEFKKSRDELHELLKARDNLIQMAQLLAEMKNDIEQGADDLNQNLLDKAKALEQLNQILKKAS